MASSDHPTLDLEGLVGMTPAQAEAAATEAGVGRVRLLETQGDRILGVITPDGTINRLDLVIGHDRLNLHVEGGVVVRARFDNESLRHPPAEVDRPS